MDKDVCSFQRVTCALLHLVTLPALVNSLLTQCYNPIVAVLADNLDLTAICDCASSLAARGSIADTMYQLHHQVRDYSTCLCMDPMTRESLIIIELCKLSIVHYQTCEPASSHVNHSATCVGASKQVGLFTASAVWCQHFSTPET